MGGSGAATTVGVAPGSPSGEPLAGFSPLLSSGEQMILDLTSPLPAVSANGHLAPYRLRNSKSPPPGPSGHLVAYPGRRQPRNNSTDGRWGALSASVVVGKYCLERCTPFWLFILSIWTDILALAGKILLLPYQTFGIVWEEWCDDVWKKAHVQLEVSRGVFGAPSAFINVGFWL